MALPVYICGSGMEMEIRWFEHLQTYEEIGVGVTSSSSAIDQTIKNTYPVCLYVFVYHIRVQCIRVGTVYMEFTMFVPPPPLLNI